MSVVQRIPRLHPTGQGYTTGLARGMAFAAPDHQVVCAVSLVAADLLAFAIALAAAVLCLIAGEPGGAAPSWLATILLCCVALGAYALSHSHYEHRVPSWRQFLDVVRADGVASAVTCCCIVLLGLPVPRLAVLGTAVLFPLVVLATRALARALLDRAGFWRVPVVVVGEGTAAAVAQASLAAHGSLGYRVVGQARAPASGGNWASLLRAHRARVLVLAPDVGGSLYPDMIAALVRERIPYAILPRMDGLPMVGAHHAFLGHEAVIVSYRNNLRKPVARAAKIAFDLLAASAALLVLAPVLLLIAALVGLDGGPVFYAHTRIGAQGRVFRCLKFRSMVVDSEAALHRLFARDATAAAEWAVSQKLRRDPRVTLIGRVLRKTSLDELPQLLNVLRLEMSLVGPRPIVSLEIPKYAEDIAYYYETRPGITGLWQVSGRSDTTYAQRVRLDTWYVKNWTLWRDLAIIARTIPAVVSGRGAG